MASQTVTYVCPRGRRTQRRVSIPGTVTIRCSCGCGTSFKRQVR